MFIQDQIRLKNWTISAGLRWDHYQLLLLNRNAVDPRFAVSRYFPSADLIAHFSDDCVFHTDPSKIFCCRIRAPLYRLIRRVSSEFRSSHRKEIIMKPG